MGHELALGSTVFAIRSGLIDEVLHSIEENETGQPFNFAIGTIRYIRATHPVLCDYIENDKFGCETRNTYELALSIAFNVVAGQLEEQGITIDPNQKDIEKLKKLKEKVFSDSIFRSKRKVVEAMKSNPLERPNTPFCNFLNILDISSPELRDRLHYYATEMNDADTLKSLVEGFYDGFMVFYQRLL